MSRRFESVGIGIPPERLQAMAAGAPIADDELVDVRFAFAACETRREQRSATFSRGRRSAVRWSIIAGVGLILLNMLICVAYAMLKLTEASPY